MSAQKHLSSKESLPYTIEKLGLTNFENFSIDLLEGRRGTKTILDISLYRSITGIEESMSKQLSQKYKVSKEDVENAMGAISYLLKQLFTNEREELVEKLKQVEKIGDKASDVVELGVRIDNKFPDIRERFYLTTYSKTSFYGDIDWEIVFKVVEHPTYHFEKKERFPVGVCRLMLEKPTSALRPYYPSFHKRESVFEVSITDIDRMITTLSSIRDKIVEAKRELSAEVEK